MSCSYITVQLKTSTICPKAVLLVDVRAAIQYARSPPSRLYFVKAESLERLERCATRGEEGGWGWKWGTRKASQQCFITSNNIRNEVLVFICFNFLQMWKAECKHHHAYNALRCDVRQTRRFFFCTGKCVLKSHWTSAGWHKDEVWPFCQMLWNFERIVSEAALLCFLSAVDR